MSYRTILSTPRARQRAKELIDQAPEGFIAELREPRRTDAQNDLMWALLGDVARAKPAGRTFTPEQWKAMFMDAVGFKPSFLPSLEGDSFLCTGYRSSKLNRSQFSDLIECIREYGARHEIEWSEA